MTTTLSEADSKRLLGAFGLPLPAEEVVATPGDAVDAADRIGYPCVVKLCGDAIAHKTERNLVRLGLSGPGPVEQAAADLLDAATAADGDVALLVAPMIRSDREFIVGAHRSDQFGAVVMVGVGGIFAEALEDVVFRLLPVDTAEVGLMLDDLRMQRLLGPFRGQPAVERAALTDVVLAVARAMVEQPDIAAIDVNPVLIQDGSPIAVDALVELR